MRRVPLAWRMIANDPVRFVITASGTGVALALMLFLASGYDGVKTESNGYVAGRPHGVWVAQGTSSNLMRATSFMSSAYTEILARSPNAHSVSPLLRLVMPMTAHGRTFTTFVCGIPAGTTPLSPSVTEGTANLTPGTIIVDHALSRRAGVTIGDVVRIQEREFHVIGFSTGTNAVVTQFAFIPIDDAAALLPPAVQYVISFLLVMPKPGVALDTLMADLRDRGADLNVLTTEQFTENNLNELRSGLLPVLATVSVFGGLVGAAVLTLLLYSAVIERREDFALLKAVGATPGYLRGLVLGQCVITVLLGFAVGVAICLLAKPILTRVVPVFVVSLSWPVVLWMGLAALGMGTVSAWLPLRRLERIYPAEVFRA